MVRQISYVALALITFSALAFGQGRAVQNHGTVVVSSPVATCTALQDATVVLDRPENNSDFNLCANDQIVIQLGVEAVDRAGSEFVITGSGIVAIEISDDGTAWTSVSAGATLPVEVDINAVLLDYQYIRLTGDSSAAMGATAASVDAVVTCCYDPGTLNGVGREFIDTVDAYTPSTSGSATFITSAEAIGYPDAFGWDETAVWNGVVSMGMGAVLEVSSTGVAATDGTGADIIVYEHEGDESEFTLEASQDGTTWFPMMATGSEAALNGAGASAADSALGFDLNGQIPWARYFRITSTSTDTAGLSPGPEIDSIEIINIQAEYQVNSVSASLDIDGVVSDSQQITSALNPQGTINIQGLQGMPYEFGITTPEGALTATSGAQVTSDGQIINLDQTAPSFFLNNGGTWSVNFPGNGAIPYSTLGVDVAVTAQFGVADPGALVGYTFSAPIRLDPATTSNSIPLALTNDDAVEIPVITSAYSNLTFCGTSYTSFFVNSNGSVTFGGADNNATPSAMLFESGLPRLAGLWTDLDPSASGSVVVSSVAGVISVTFTNVPEFAVGATSTTSSFAMEFDLASGSCSITGYAADVGLATPTLVGLSCGVAGGATNNGAQSFSSQSGLGAQTPTAITDVIYEFLPTAAPAGFASIVFTNSDPSSWTVN